MECKNHPEAAAIERCTGCAEPFCGDCLVDMHGQKYCGSCKVMAIKAPIVLEEATLPCQEANDALKYAIIGIFCFGIILEPMAFAKALKAKQMIDMDPRLAGSGKVTVAIIMSVIAMALWIIGLVSRAMAAGRSY